MVHRIDQRASGQIVADELVTNLRSSDRYLVSSLVEEAITSSQLEGASTTRTGGQGAAGHRAAAPRPERADDREQLPGDAVRRGARRPSVDPRRRCSTSTDSSPTARSTIRRTPVDLQGPDDERIASSGKDDTLLHRPPPADELPDRLDALCRFANGELGEGFVHPVVRAIIVHFWMAYDHPFADGNGRTARVLFYWTMLREGYWLAQYLSISAILRNAPVQYARSYLYTETDGNDLTYFVIYQLQVIGRAIASLHEYLARKVARRGRSKRSCTAHQCSTTGNSPLSATRSVTRASHSRSPPRRDGTGWRTSRPEPTCGAWRSSVCCRSSGSGTSSCSVPCRTSDTACAASARADLRGRLSPHFLPTSPKLGEVATVSRPGGRCHGQAFPGRRRQLQERSRRSAGVWRDVA